MKTHTIIFLCLVALSVYLMIGCDEPRDFSADLSAFPMHFNRVPRPTNLTYTVGQAFSKRPKISLSWQYVDNGNLQNFEVWRSLIDTALAPYIPLQPSTTVPSYVDSTLPHVSDSLNVYYYVVGNGKDRFVGQPSDPIMIVLRK